MEIVLLERVENLGGIGDVVTVKNGHARNWLLPQGKALRATKANIAYFEAQRADIEKRNAEKRAEAEKAAEAFDDPSIVVIRQAGETGQLYGSVSTRDVADALSEKGQKVARSQVRLDRPIKEIGVYTVPVFLHAEVKIDVQVNVARSLDEAERQAKGEDLRGRRDAFAEEDAEILAEAEEVFDDGAAPAELGGDAPEAEGGEAASSRR